MIIPIYKDSNEHKYVEKIAEDLMSELQSQNIRVKYDNRDKFKPGFKFNEYELKGVPLRLAIGPKDINDGTIEIVRRDNFSKETVKQNDIIKEIKARLNEIQNTLYLNAKKFQEENTTYVDNYEDFKETLNNKGGFIAAHWDGTNSTEEAIKKETKATIRCIPMDKRGEGFLYLFR